MPKTFFSRSWPVLLVLKLKGIREMLISPENFNHFVVYVVDKDQSSL